MAINACTQRAACKVLLQFADTQGPEMRRVVRKAVLEQIQRHRMAMWSTRAAWRGTAQMDRAFSDGEMA